MIFDDQFSGTSLDTTKWNTYLGAQGIVWNNRGHLPSPYSGPNNAPFTNEAAMFGPSQVSVNDGLTLTAQRNTNAYAGTYPWISGAITTEGKFSLPTTGWYVQAKIKVPDMTQGMWPSMWFLPAVRGPFNEIDFVQGGLTEGGGPVNQSPLGTAYFPTGRSSPVGETFPDLGFDATAGYHIYGVQWTPGVGVEGLRRRQARLDADPSTGPRWHRGRALRDHPRSAGGDRLGPRLSHPPDGHFARRQYEGRGGGGVLINSLTGCFLAGWLLFGAKSVRQVVNAIVP